MVINNIQLTRDSKNYFQYIENSISQKDIIIRNITAGLCGTDKDIIANSRLDSSSILGHEAVGRVVYSSPNSTFKTDNFIAYSPVSAFDQIDILGHSINGIFQHYNVFSESDINRSKHIFKLKNKPQNWFGPLIEPLAVSVYSHEIISMHGPLKTALILGTGGIARTLALFLTTKGISVTLYSMGEDKYYSVTNSGFISNLTIDSKRVYDVIFCCQKRANANSAYHLALNFSTKNTVICFVNGFNNMQTVQGYDNSGKKYYIDDIRRMNTCGTHHIILKNVDGTGYITGHRGCSHEHFSTAERELNNFSEYKNIISHEIHFNELGKFLNSHKTSFNSFRGKLLIHFGE